MSRVLVCFVALVVASAAWAVDELSAAKKQLPLPGEVFEFRGRTAFLILPKATAAKQPTPWVWYAPTLPNLPGREEKWMFERFTEAGLAVAGIDVGESYGSPDGRALFSAFHEEVTTHRGLAPKPVLLGRSRGGLMTLSWAAENAEKVAGFAGIYPVCNLSSYPGLAKASGAYGLTPEELSARLAEHNPIDRLAALAKARVPLFAIHGDRDNVVPLEVNSGVMRQRYEALGGSMQLVVPPGQGHNMWSGFFQSQELVDFVLAQTAGKPRSAAMTLSSPLEWQVFQRHTRDRGQILISGKLAGAGVEIDAIETRMVVGDQSEAWQRTVGGLRDSAFTATIPAPAGGWHRLEVRALRNSEVIAETAVAKFGIGEIFVVAGQSNSANHGAEKQTARTGMVAAFDGTRWQPADDPQPGASGRGGSFLPPFGDTMAQRFGVPIGLIACGIGATSVREWLPEGVRFSRPPTIENRVRKLASGEWESGGEAFANLVRRMQQAGPRGFRAVLWHQGESDANQRDATRTLPGPLYREHLETVIRESRRVAGWEAPWFVAQVSYHTPDDPGSPEIRAAQASLWKDGIALEGPDSDALRGELRENDGKGVHFSGPGLREHAARWVEKVAPWLERTLNEPVP